MKIIQAYRCEYCPRTRPYVTPRAIAAHESRCFHNPETHSCATCENLRHSHKPGARKGYVTDAWSCTADAPLAPLTTNCPAWKPQVSYEF